MPVVVCVSRGRQVSVVSRGIRVVSWIRSRRSTMTATRSPRRHSGCGSTRWVSLLASIRTACGGTRRRSCRRWSSTGRARWLPRLVSLAWSMALTPRGFRRSGRRVTTAATRWIRGRSRRTWGCLLRGRCWSRAWSGCRRVSMIRPRVGFCRLIRCRVWLVPAGRVIRMRLPVMIRLIFLTR